jgi:hypothetical protein
MSLSLLRFDRRARTVGYPITRRLVFALMTLTHRKRCVVMRHVTMSRHGLARVDFIGQWREPAGYKRVRIGRCWRRPQPTHACVSCPPSGRRVASVVLRLERAVRSRVAPRENLAHARGELGLGRRGGGGRGGRGRQRRRSRSALFASVGACERACRACGRDSAAHLGARGADGLVAGPFGGGAAGLRWTARLARRRTSGPAARQARLPCR